MRYSLLLCVLFWGCQKSSLSPARNISGQWKASAAVTVYEITNCTTSGNVATYASFPCTFTFNITAIDDNDVQVDIYGSARSGKSDDCGESPPIEDGYPVTFTGKISSSALTLTDQIYGMNTSGVIEFANFDVGDFTFTTNILSGKIYWLQYYSSQGAIGWETDKITLTK
jgi:hypothetical protein